MQFKTTSETAHVHGIKICVYGPAGIGKTVLTATAPKPILISAESGLLSLNKNNLIRLFGQSQQICYDIPLIEIKTMKDLQEAYNWCRLNAARYGIETVCIDSASEIAEVLLASLKKSHKDIRQAYGDLLEQMMQLIRDFRDLPGLNVYMSAKMEPMKNELTGAINYGPSMPGAKLSPQIPYMFDELFRFAIGTDQKGVNFRYLQTQPDFSYQAKDRSGALEMMEMPNLTHIFNKIKGI